MFDRYHVPNSLPIDEKKEMELSRHLQQLKLSMDNSELSEEERKVARYKYLEFRAHFAEHFYYLINKEASRLCRQCRKGLEFGDLFQSGVCGLMRAIDNHDFRSSSRFSTYAMYAIRTEMYRTLDNNNRTIRIPTYKIEKLFCGGSTEANDSELEELKRDAVSMFIDGDTIDIPDTRSDSTGCKVREAIELALSYLNNRSADVLRKKYLYNYSISEIANNAGDNGQKVSKQRVRQLIKTATKHLLELRGKQEVLLKISSILEEEECECYAWE